MEYIQQIITELQYWKLILEFYHWKIPDKNAGDVLGWSKTICKQNTLQVQLLFWSLKNVLGCFIVGEHPTPHIKAKIILFNVRNRMYII